MGPPPESSPDTSDTEVTADVFEGPEKKLELYFCRGSNEAGFRQFQTEVWSDVLIAASCTILHQQANTDFDAYLLSESSLFVFSHRVILKTCGTTTLLLVLPKLLMLAEQIGCAIEHVLYGHYRYKFPDQQVYPHLSFQQEQDYLSRTFDNVQSRVLGPVDGCCWNVLYASSKAVPVLAPLCPASSKDGDDIFEVAMEGLSPAVCAQFFKVAHPDVTGKELACRMTSVSGIGLLLPGVEVDDWAFEPCGYSMNGLRGGFYYTIHVTPEPDFSYASFETNDPMYRDPDWVKRIASTFAPSVLTMTLTTRRIGCELEAYSLDGFERNSFEITQLGKHISVCCMNFSRDELQEPETMVGGTAVKQCGRWWA